MKKSDGGKSGKKWRRDRGWGGKGDSGNISCGKDRKLTNGEKKVGDGDGLRKTLEKGERRLQTKRRGKARAVSWVLGKRPEYMCQRSTESSPKAGKASC